MSWNAPGGGSGYGNLDAHLNKKSMVGFYFQVKHSHGTFCVAKAGRDLAGVTYARWSLKLMLILVSNVLLHRGFGMKLRLR